MQGRTYGSAPARLTLRVGHYPKKDCAGRHSPFPFPDIQGLALTEQLTV